MKLYHYVNIEIMKKAIIYFEGKKVGTTVDFDGISSKDGVIMFYRWTDEKKKDYETVAYFPEVYGFLICP